MKILITGSSGKCGSCLHDLPYDLILYDKNPSQDSAEKGKFIQGSLDNISQLKRLMNKGDILIHLAASSNPKSSRDEIMKNNIQGTERLFHAAAEAKVEKIIFASSNHVVGMVEIENRPEIYQIGHKIKVNKYHQVRPDSHYGVSKAFGENLGRYYAETTGIKFLAIRIGAVLEKENDHPYAYAEAGVKNKNWDRDSAAYNIQKDRLKAIWQSRRDFRQMIELCITYDSTDYDVFYGTSENQRSWLDIDYARTTLGYCPQDKAEEWILPKKDK